MVSLVCHGVTASSWCHWFVMVSLVYHGVTGLSWCHWFVMVSLVCHDVTRLSWCHWFVTVSRVRADHSNSVQVIQLDIMRTFPTLGFFQKVSFYTSTMQPVSVALHSAFVTPSSPLPQPPSLPLHIPPSVPLPLCPTPSAPPRRDASCTRSYTMSLVHTPATDLTWDM